MKFLRNSCPLLFVPLLPLLAVSGRAQAIQNQSATQFPGEQSLTIAAAQPAPSLTELAPGEVTLRAGLWHDRRELTKAYLLRLKTDNVLQNHLLEAGLRIDRPYEQMHQGWESPHYQLRGHFAGHWLSAAARYAAIDHDAALTARVTEAVAELQHCQTLNGGQWVGSIPEKYFDILADNRVPIWSPQYTLHKTMMGLFDTERYLHDAAAGKVLAGSAQWFDAWTQRMITSGHGAAVYGGESPACWSYGPIFTGRRTTTATCDSLRATRCPTCSRRCSMAATR